MSGREWKPGDVALVTAANRKTPYRAFFDGSTWREADKYALFCVDQPTSIRPLVALDLADMDWLPNRLRHDGDRIGGVTGAKMADLADQIEAQIPPPKPEEPLGLGAVVEDNEGERWILVHLGRHVPGNRWAKQGRVGSLSNWRAYAEIAAEHVLSEGVTL